MRENELSHIITSTVWLPSNISGLIALEFGFFSRREFMSREDFMHPLERSLPLNTDAHEKELN